MRFEVKNGTFSYSSKKKVLNDINFSINQGEILSIIGSNGVGKTTLIKCMLGFLKWSDGESLIDDENIKNIKSKDLWKLIGYVPQAKKTVFPYTALEMVMLGRSAHLDMFAAPRKEDEDIALEALEMVGAEFLKDSLCSQISGGELQMILIARALATKPKMLVLDEPESNLDLKNQAKVISTIEKICSESNISTIINTHYPEHALRISDKTLLLGKKFQKFGNSKDVITEENLEKIFDIPISINTFEKEDKLLNAVIPVY